jgi:hypothetical protein
LLKSFNKKETSVLVVHLLNGGHIQGEVGGVVGDKRTPTVSVRWAQAQSGDGLTEFKRCVLTERGARKQGEIEQAEQWIVDRWPSMAVEVRWAIMG